MAINQIKTESFLYTKNTLQLEFCEGINIFIGGNGTGKTTLLKKIYSEQNGKIIFIPAVNILPYSRGLTTLDEKYNLAFDKILLDIIKNAELPELKKVTPQQQKLLTKLSEIISGTVVFENGIFYVLKNTGEKIEFAVEAQGFTKLGLLWKIIRNGLLEKGAVLLWDEPENSLNPKLMKDLAEILLSLSEMGVQIFIATHNYSMARWFELLKKEKNTLRYFNLFATENGIFYNQADDYTSLDSVLDEADEDIYKAVVAKALGVKVDE